jgi:hypothetical protein
MEPEVRGGQRVVGPNDGEPSSVFRVELKHEITELVRDTSPVVYGIDSNGGGVNGIEATRYLLNA